MYGNLEMDIILNGVVFQNEWCLTKMVLFFSPQK